MDAKIIERLNDPTDTNEIRVRVKDDAIDLHGDPHPMRGMTGILVEEFGNDLAGFDCRVAYDCEPFDVADRLGVSLEEWEEMFATDPSCEYDGRPVLDDKLENLVTIS